MTEETTQNSPLIDPESLQAVSQPSPTTPAAGPRAAEGPSATPLGPKEYRWGTGRRKKAIARVRLRSGSGKLLINGRQFEQYFPDPRDQKSVQAPLVAADSMGRYDIWANVNGGGSTGQAGAVLLGIARALIRIDPDCYAKLKDGGYLTRDSRIKERKKYGQRGARRSFQFSKR